MNDIGRQRSNAVYFNHAVYIKTNWVLVPMSTNAGFVLCNVSLLYCEKWPIRFLSKFNHWWSLRHYRASLPSLPIGPLICNFLGNNSHFNPQFLVVAQCAWLAGLHLALTRQPMDFRGQKRPKGSIIASTSTCLISHAVCGSRWPCQWFPILPSATSVVSGSSYGVYNCHGQHCVKYFLHTLNVVDCRSFYWYEKVSILLWGPDHWWPSFLNDQSSIPGTLSTRIGVVCVPVAQWPWSTYTN